MSNYRTPSASSAMTSHKWCWRTYSPFNSVGMWWWDNGELCTVQEHTDHN